MTNYEENIGRYLVSVDLGIGEIRDIKEISDNGLFYHVVFPEDNMTNYFSVDSSKYRMVTTKDEIEKAIEVFKADGSMPEFSSVKDKINYYKNALKTQKVEELAKHLTDLRTEEEIHAGLKAGYERALDSFIQEVGFVLNISKKEAKKLLAIEKV